MQQTSAILARTFNVLEALTRTGVKYRIEMPDGQSFGNIEMPKVQAKPRKVYRPFGSVNAAIMPFLKAMDVGDVREIPVPKDFSAAEFQSAVCARATELWGKETYTTASSKDVVEVLRYA